MYWAAMEQNQTGTLEVKIYFRGRKLAAALSSLDMAAFGCEREFMPMATQSHNETANPNYC